MDFIGAQQTCFSDWGRTLTEFFSDPKFAISGAIVNVYSDGEHVGHYDFDTGTGKIADGFQVQPPSHVGRFQSFSDIPIDTFLQQ